MSYLVFARKFRPQSFADVTGQQAVVQTLQNALTGGRIAHAFCFAGPRGVGKTTTARLLAKALNCATGPTAEPCGECSSCREITTSSSMDTLEIDGASNRGIDDVKSLRESLQYNPARDRYKVVIIDEVHMLSTPAFNALLKTLEEPPPHAKFIFATTELHKVPPTILSRCQVYEFRRIPFAQMVERLRVIIDHEQLSATDDALALIARNSDGCMRDAESMLDQVVAFGGDEIDEELVRSVLGLIGFNVIFEAMAAILDEDAARVLALVERVTDAGTDVRQFAARMSEHLRNLLVARLVPEPGGLIAASESDLAQVVSQAGRLNDDEILRLLNLMAKGEEELKNTSSPRFTLERLLLHLIQARRMTPIPEILAALGHGGVTAGGAAPVRPAPALKPRPTPMADASREPAPAVAKPMPPPPRPTPPTAPPPAATPAATAPAAVEVAATPAATPPANPVAVAPAADAAAPPATPARTPAARPAIVDSPTPPRHVPEQASVGATAERAPEQRAPAPPEPVVSLEPVAATTTRVRPARPAADPAGDSAKGRRHAEPATEGRGHGRRGRPERDAPVARPIEMKPRPRVARPPVAADDPRRQEADRDPAVARLRQLFMAEIVAVSDPD